MQRMEGVKQASREMPSLYSHMTDASRHVEMRAWTGLYNFLTANSILVLAWATIFSSGGGEKNVARDLVMCGVSTIGIFSGLAWALLGVRTWHYALVFRQEIRRIENRMLSMGALVPEGLSSLVRVHQTVGKHWWPELAESRRQKWLRNAVFLSWNQWVLFVIPVLFSGLHMWLATVALWPRIVAHEESSGWLWEVLVVLWIVYVVILMLVYCQCRPALIHGWLEKRSDQGPPQ